MVQIGAKGFKVAQELSHHLAETYGTKRIIYFLPQPGAKLSHTSSVGFRQTAADKLNDFSAARLLLQGLFATALTLIELS
jgi:hypothetical protein